MSDPTVASADATNESLAQGHEAFVAELRSTLDIEAGIRDALLPTAHLAFAADLYAALDIESGLAAALPDVTETTPPASAPPDGPGPGIPPSSPTSFVAETEERADSAPDRADSAPPPPRVRRTRRNQNRGWTPPPPNEED
jgi:hypothetical protein